MVRALIALQEDLGLIPSTFMVAYSHLFQMMSLSEVLSEMSTAAVSKTYRLLLIFNST